MRFVMSIGLLLGLALPLTVGHAHPREPLREVLGIFPGMPEREAHHRLQRFGTRNPENGGTREAEDKRETEIWTLVHPRFTYVVIAMDRQGRVQYVQGYLRKDRRRLSYRDIGDLGKARQTGYYIYTWEVPARGDRAGLQVQARGSDPEFPGSYLITVRSTGQTEDEAGDRSTGRDVDGGRRRSTGP
jgi:hypothetical protein